MTLDHLREIALIQISQSQRNAAMQVKPVFFVHGGRVVRGTIAKRVNQHKFMVSAQNYVLPDGSDQPIPLDFKRRLGHEEVTNDAAVLLALLPEPTGEEA